MIVVAGSRHDPVAAELARRWPGAALCDAEDLMAPGWCWPAQAGSGLGDRRWVVGGEVVADAEATGVFLRRAGVYPDELARTHPDDRAYLAAEAYAFLVYILATTGAVVVNPVSHGSAGADALRPERWMPVAAELGVPVAPLRLTSATLSKGTRPPTQSESLVEVVASEASPAGSLADAAVAVAAALALRWAVAGFDRAGRLSTLTTTPAPSPEAAGRLGVLLAGLPARAA